MYILYMCIYIFMFLYIINMITVYYSVKMDNEQNICEYPEIKEYRIYLMVTVYCE